MSTGSVCGNCLLTCTKIPAETAHKRVGSDEYVYAQMWASLVTFYTHHFVASQLIRVNLLSLISLVLLDGGNVCDQLYVVIQEDLTNTVDITESEHPDGKEPLLKNL